MTHTIVPIEDILVIQLSTAFRLERNKYMLKLLIRSGNIY